MTQDILAQAAPLIYHKAFATWESLQDPSLSRFDAEARAALAHENFVRYVSCCRLIRSTFVSLLAEYKEGTFFPIVGVMTEGRAAAAGRDYLTICF